MQDVFVVKCAMSSVHHRFFTLRKCAMKASKHSVWFCLICCCPLVNVSYRGIVDGQLSCLIWGQWSSPVVTVGSYLPRGLGGGAWTDPCPPATFGKAAAESDGSATSFMWLLKFRILVESTAQKCVVNPAHQSRTVNKLSIIEPCRCSVRSSIPHVPSFPLAGWCMLLQQLRAAQPTKSTRHNSHSC